MEVVPSTALSYPGSALAYVDDEHFAYIMVIQQMPPAYSAAVVGALHRRCHRTTPASAAAADAAMTTITTDQARVLPAVPLEPLIATRTDCHAPFSRTQRVTQLTTGQRAPVRGRHHWQDQDLPLGRPSRHLGVRLLVQGTVGGGGG